MLGVGRGLRTVKLFHIHLYLLNPAVNLSPEKGGIYIGLIRSNRKAFSRTACEIVRIFASTNFFSKADFALTSITCKKKKRNDVRCQP